MARDALPLLLVGLAGAVGLLWYSRTRSGGQATSDAFDAAMRAAREASNVVSTAAAEGVQLVQDLTLPRGIRNHNPGNIVRGAQWKGIAPAQTDPRFVVFTAPEWGIRAMARVLRNYMARGNVTIAGILNTWAPPVENNTAAYIAAVSKELGIPANVPISTAAFPGLIAAIIRHENGTQPYPPAVIAKGVELERTA